MDDAIYFRYDYRSRLQQEERNGKRGWVRLVWFWSRLVDFALLFGKRQIALSPLDIRTSGDMGQERRKEEVSSTVGGSFAWFPTDLAGGRNGRHSTVASKTVAFTRHNTRFYQYIVRKGISIFFPIALCMFRFRTDKSLNNSLMIKFRVRSIYIWYKATKRESNFNSDFY